MNRVLWAATTALATGIAVLSLAGDAPPAGELPRAADGRPLNLDFETGDLRDCRMFPGFAFLWASVGFAAVA